MKTYPFRIILILLPLIFLCYCHTANRPQKDAPPQTFSAPAPAHTDAQEAAPPVLKLYASGACLMDTSTGRILYGKEENTSLPMASTTKIMTCLLALENGNPAGEVTFSKRAASMPKVRLGASAGSTFRLEDLLYSLMLESHNDTAVAIAEHVGGSVEGFAALMNAKAAEIGMTQTNFVTPNGLDADGHGSTPADMCRLAAYACRNEAFLNIVQTPSRTITTVNGGRSYSLSNKDAFLTSYEGALGIKTGFTGKAGYCFVGAARKGERTFVSCVLASGWPPNKSYKWADTKALMNFGFETYDYQNIQIQDLSGVRIPVQDGKSDTVGITTPVIPSFLIGKYDTIDVTYNIPSHLKAPIRKDTCAGAVDIYINQELAGSFPVYPQEDIDEIRFEDVLNSVVHLFLGF